MGKLPHDVDIESGHLGSLDTAGTGWFLGSGEWLGHELRRVPPGERISGLCAKWVAHPRGDPRGRNKPISEGRTIALLVSSSGGFRLQFAWTADFSGEVREHVLVEHGQFVAWGENLYHRWIVEEPSTIMTIRWNPGEAVRVPRAAP